MKTLLLILALLNVVARLGAQPHIVSIVANSDPLFGNTVTVFATQLANKSVTIEAASQPNFSDAYTGAFYDCHTERQTVSATFPSGPPRNFAFFRARNDPCNELVSPFILFADDPFAIEPPAQVAPPPAAVAKPNTIHIEVL